jgi:predicted DNA-binding protein
MISPIQYNTPTSKRTMSLKQLNVKIPEQELRILEAFAEKTERTKTDIIREFIRSLQAKIWQLAW